MEESRLKEIEDRARMVRTPDPRRELTMQETVLIGLVAKEIPELTAEVRALQAYLRAAGKTFCELVPHLSGRPGGTCTEAIRTIEDILGAKFGPWSARPTPFPKPGDDSTEGL